MSRRQIACLNYICYVSCAYRSANIHPPRRWYRPVHCTALQCTPATHPTPLPLCSTTFAHNLQMATRGMNTCVSDCFPNPACTPPTHPMGWRPPLHPFAVSFCSHLRSQPADGHPGHEHLHDNACTQTCHSSEIIRC